VLDLITLITLNDPSHFDVSFSFSFNIDYRL